MGIYYYSVMVIDLKKKIQAQKQLKWYRVNSSLKKQIISSKLQKDSFETGESFFSSKLPKDELGSCQW